MALYGAETAGSADVNLFPCASGGFRSQPVELFSLRVFFPSVQDSGTVPHFASPHNKVCYSLTL